MPHWQKARIEEASFVSPPRRPQLRNISRHIQSFAAGTGSRITISFRPFPYSPIRMSWQAYIQDFVWNEYFCDEQLRGPFAYWLHCHRVTPEERSGVAGTHVIDDVTYEIKFGALGEIAHTILIERQMKRMFEYRQKRLEELLAQISERLHKQS